MGPLSFDELRERLEALHSERKLEELGQLWEAFGLRGAFLETTGNNVFSALVFGELGVGSLKEVGGSLSLQLTSFQAMSGCGIKERPENTHLILYVGDKEMHLPWPGSLAEMLQDACFRWLMARLRGTGEGRMGTARLAA
jgi:hypothetical protein